MSSLFWGIVQAGICLNFEQIFHPFCDFVGFFVQRLCNAKNKKKRQSINGMLEKAHGCLVPETRIELVRCLSASGGF